MVTFLEWGYLNLKPFHLSNVSLEELDVSLPPVLRVGSWARLNPTSVSCTTLMPNYDKSVEDVFRDAAEYCLTSERIPRSLTLLDDRSEKLINPGPSSWLLDFKPTLASILTSSSWRDRESNRISLLDSQPTNLFSPLMAVTAEKELLSEGQVLDTVIATSNEESWQELVETRARRSRSIRDRLSERLGSRDIGTRVLVEISEFALALKPWLGQWIERAEMQQMPSNSWTIRPGWRPCLYQHCELCLRAS